MSLSNNYSFCLFGCLGNDDLENEDLRSIKRQPSKRWPRKWRPRKRRPTIIGTSSCRNLCFSVWKRLKLVPFHRARGQAVTAVLGEASGQKIARTVGVFWAEVGEVEESVEQYNLHELCCASPPLPPSPFALHPPYWFHCLLFPFFLFFQRKHWQCSYQDFTRETQSPFSLRIGLL